jgi:hypothetical protein
MLLKDLAASLNLCRELRGARRPPERNDSCRSNGIARRRENRLISLFDTNVAPAKVYFGAPMTTYGSPVYEAAIAFLNAHWPQAKIVAPAGRFPTTSHWLENFPRHASECNGAASCYWPEIAFRWVAFREAAWLASRPGLRCLTSIEQTTNHLVMRRSGRSGRRRRGNGSARP